ncbi:MAG: hypothetical protein E4H01_06825, partial [Lysobacterales bacterium]
MTGQPPALDQKQKDKIATLTNNQESILIFGEEWQNSQIYAERESGKIVFYVYLDNEESGKYDTFEDAYVAYSNRIKQAEPEATPEAYQAYLDGTTAPDIPEPTSQDLETDVTPEEPDVGLVSDLDPEVVAESREKEQVRQGADDLIAAMSDDELVAALETELENTKTAVYGHVDDHNGPRIEFIEQGVQRLRRSGHPRADEITQGFADKMTYQTGRDGFLTRMDRTAEADEIAAFIEGEETTLRAGGTNSFDEYNDVLDAIDELADMGDIRAFDLLKAYEFQQTKDGLRIEGTTTDPRFKHVKGKRVEIQDVSSMGLSARAGGTSHTISYDSFKPDVARGSRGRLAHLINVYNKTHDREFDVALYGPVHKRPITTYGGVLPNGITQARMDRIQKLLAKYPEKLTKDPYSNKWIYAPRVTRKINFLLINGNLVLHSVDRSGLEGLNQYESKKTTHLKEALELMDQDLRFQDRYAERQAAKESEPIEDISFENVEALAAKIKEEHGLESFEVEMDIDGQIEVFNIEVAEKDRRQGKGAAAMRDLLDYAEAQRVQVWLTPSIDDQSGGPAEGLHEFYTGLGFEPSDLLPGSYTYHPRSHNDIGRDVPVSPEVEAETDELPPLFMNADEFESVVTEWEHLMADPGKKNRVAIDTALEREGSPFIPLEEAQARINQWRQDALDQRDHRELGHQWLDNSTRTIISLFDRTGNWARPYAEAGYQVYAFDIQNGIDITDMNVEWFNDNFNIYDVYGIMAACPCTTFTNTSNRWKEDRYNVKSREWIARMWGEKAEAAVDEEGNYKYETPNDYAIELVQQSLRVIEYFRPKFWALENPQGTIEKQTDLKNWRTGFQPSNFGHPYTKRTILWGTFNPNLPTANVDPIEGSKMHGQMGGGSLETKNARSETPEGFAYAFFKANNFLDTDPIERTAADFTEADGAVRAAMKAGMSEEVVRELMETTYGNYEYQDARDILREETAKLLPAEP